MTAQSGFLLNPNLVEDDSRPREQAELWTWPKLS
jgi:hypothetical protein